LKLYWSEEKKKYEREQRQPVTKENFLAIYGAAHVRALMAETIKAAFRKTGLWPFNREVVTEAMMAPSLETSVRGHLPVAPSTPVRVMTDLLYRARERAKKPGSSVLRIPKQTMTTHLIPQPLKGTILLLPVVAVYPLSTHSRLRSGTPSQACKQRPPRS
jgi:5-formyltetrahydrofolate cyclo-ligase